MKTKLFLVITLLITLTNLFAQDNINVDNLRFQYFIRLMPKYPRNPIFFYYYTKIKAPESVLSVLNSDDLFKSFYIYGQQETNKATNDDYIITAELERIEIVSSEVKSKYKDEKDKKGNPIRIYSFWMEVSYTFGAKGYFTRGSNTIDSYTLKSRSNKLVYKSTEYATPQAARDFWRENKEDLIGRFTRECSKNAIESFTAALNRDYGFDSSVVSALIKTMNTKKHPENDRVRGASNRLKTIMDNLNSRVPPNEDEMNGLIDYFKSIPARYRYPKLKADVRLRYIAYYNLCRIYIFIDQPEKVRQYADLLYQNGHDTKDRDRLIKDADAVQVRLNNSIFKRSQFTTDSYFK